jgi:uncharacterized protein
MNELLHKGIKPENIIYLTGELINDHHTLVRLIAEETDQEGEGIRFLLLDEVSYIKDWDKGVKFLADSGQLESVILVLTGSDTVFIKEAKIRFPGRRGRADVRDFHLYPLSYTEFIRLKKHFSEVDLVQIVTEKEQVADSVLDLLYNEFENYLIHGGYLYLCIGVFETSCF